MSAGDEAKAARGVREAGTGESAGRGWRKAITGAYLAGVVFFVWSFAQFYVPGQGFSYLIAFGGDQAARRISDLKDVDYYVQENSAGYDAQYYAQIAIHPSLRDPELERAVDSLPYRGRRILICWTSYALGWGRPAWIVQAYALQNALCWLALAAVLLRWFPPVNGSNLLRWGGVMFSFGLCISVRNSLIDGPSLLLIALALWAVERNRPWLATGLLALSGLGKETNLLGASALAPDALRPWRRWALAALRAGLIAAPLALWLWYIHRTIGSATDAGARNFAAPLVAYGGKWRAVAAGLTGPGRNVGTWWSLLMLVSLTVQFAFIVLRPQWREAWWRVAFTFALLMVFLGDAVWEGYPGAASRVLLPMQLAFNVLVPRGERWWVVLVLGNLTVLGAPTAFEPPPGPGYEVRGREVLAPADRQNVKVRFAEGWYGVEGAAGHSWCWSKSDAVLEIYNPDERGRRVELNFVLNSLAPRQVRIGLDRDGGEVASDDEAAEHGAGEIDGQEWSGEATQQRREVKLPEMALAPGWNRVVFETDRPGDMPAADNRALTFCVRDIVVTIKQ